MSINTATHQYSECELTKIKFFLCPATHDGPCFPVSKALAVVTSNVPNRHWLDQLELSEWTLSKESDLPNVPVDADKVSVLVMKMYHWPTQCYIIVGETMLLTSPMQWIAPFGYTWLRRQVRKKMIVWQLLSLCFSSIRERTTSTSRKVLGLWIVWFSAAVQTALSRQEIEATKETISAKPEFAARYR